MASAPVTLEAAVEGASGEPLVHTLTRTDLVVYAGASGDFNPMHTDEVAAEAAGLPSVFGHGMFTAGLLASAVEAFVGAGNLLSFKVRFTRQTWPGEVLTTSVVVRERDQSTGRIVLDCAVRNGDGEVKLTGEAVALPARAS